MSPVHKVNIVLLMTALSITGCSSSPEPKKNNPYNDADSQRTRSHQTQGEMTRETSK